MEGPKTDVAPWEIDEETEEERQIRYKREAEEMKLKWDARRLEEKQSAEKRRAWASKERERAQLYGPRDPIMEAYEARMYEEARVIEVRRRQREVYERIKAHKLGKPLPPKGEPYVKLRPLPVEPPRHEDFDVSGHYIPEEDEREQEFKAPESYVSPTGPAPPPRHMRGTPRAAWEDPPYGPPNPNARPAPARGPPSRPPPSAPPKPAPAPAAAAPAAAAPAAKEEAAKPPAKANLPTAAEVKGMKVPDLREALEAAGLDSSGKKADLVARLMAAIEG